MMGISVESAIAVTELSRRTWWRRIAEGKVKRVADDARGRAMLHWPDVLPNLCLELNADDLALLARADAGEAGAQCDIGQLFFGAERQRAALYWFLLAAQQDHADAMQWLGHCYTAGAGVAKDENLGLMWLAKAAAHGHVIAQAQINGLLQR